MSDTLIKNMSVGDKVVCMNKIELAQKFAHDAHDSIGQKRKYTGEPYWVHTDEVARIVSETPGHTEDMICAAHLHDVLEDVAPNDQTGMYGYLNIKSLFGEDVAKFVVELTDVYTKEGYGDLNRKQRKELERERIGKTSPEAKTIKLADLISNTKSIVEHDPDFAQTYLKEKIALLPYLADGSPHLLQLASAQAIAARTRLGIDTSTPRS